MVGATQDAPFSLKKICVMPHLPAAFFYSCCTEYLLIACCGSLPLPADRPSEIVECNFLVVIERPMILSITTSEGHDLLTIRAKCFKLPVYFRQCFAG
jgi:hypothetical protein